MAVGKGSMARASKAVKKATEPIKETKVEVVEEVKEAKEVKEVKKEKKPVAKKRAEKKIETASDMIAIGDEMPVFYL